MSTPHNSVPLGIPSPRNTRQSLTFPPDLPPATEDGSRTLADRYGRVARDLRVSVTDKCNLRCTYCMPEQGFEWIEQPKLLSDDELIRLITLAVGKLGVRHVRFTGGEPLLRKSLATIISATTAMTTDEGKAPNVALTTNGLGLEHRVDELKAAGLQRINISLDTIDPQQFAQLTRRDRLDDVLRGIDAALNAGLRPVKINAVIIPGINEDSIIELTRFCLEIGAQLRFIEHMPLGPREQWKRSELVTAQDIVERLSHHFTLKPAPVSRGSSPAQLWDVYEPHKAGSPAKLGSVGSVGIIASVTESFCGACDRTRLTADGAVRNCLFGNAELSLRDLLRAGASDDELAAAWAAHMWEKLPGHGVNDEGYLQPSRPMSAIGG